MRTCSRELCSLRGAKFPEGKCRVFIDSEMRLYRVIGSRLVSYRFEYDFWYDDDKPNNVEIIINVMMILELFPPEICNVIYCEFMNQLRCVSKGDDNID